MPYLMQINFDNDHRLKRKHYLFEYNGVKFKLIQNNPRKWADALLTILPNDDVAAREYAYAVGSEFCSALSWQNGARVMMGNYGGRGITLKYPLSRTYCFAHTFPKIPYGGSIVGYDISPIPKVETEAQRVALTLFREAGASNNDYLSFFSTGKYWKRVGPMLKIS